MKSAPVPGRNGTAGDVTEDTNDRRSLFAPARARILMQTWLGDAGSFSANTDGGAAGISDGIRFAHPKKNRKWPEVTGKPIVFEDTNEYSGTGCAGDLG